MEIELNITPLSYYQYLKNNRYGSRYMTKNGKIYKEQITTMILEKHKNIKCYKCDLSVSLEFYHTNKRKNDIDNNIKPILDILQGICYIDDRQIVELNAKKFITKEAKIVIKINPITLT